MKKIENVLILPALVLLVLIFVEGTSTLDLHLHDTYFVIAHASIAKWFLYWLVVAFILYTIIRYRHKRVNSIWAVIHISLTIVLMSVIWYLAALPGFRQSNGWADLAYEQAFLRKLEWRNLWLVIAILTFLLNQIVFLAYFVTRLFQTPELQ